MGKPFRFAVVGAGYRTEAFLNIASALPSRFEVTGVFARREERRTEIEQDFRVKAFATLDEMLAYSPVDFVVVSVSRGVAEEYVAELVERGIPVLVETPPAETLDGLLSLYQKSKAGKVQVAEQYAFQPLHAARLRVVQNGLIGSVNQAVISCAHDYHGISLMRKFLNITTENVTIRAMRFDCETIEGAGRQGPPDSERMIKVPRDMAWFDFGDRLGVYDFTTDQYHHEIRSHHIAVRGVRGEIVDQRVQYLKDVKTPIYQSFERVNKGEHGQVEGYYLKGFILADDWVYENPFLPARLYDDEIAIAECLVRMGQYVHGAAAFYGLAEASQDMYLTLLMKEAIETGQPVVSQRQSWADVWS